MKNVENKTSQDAEGRVLDAVSAAAKKGKWLAMVFSIEDGFPRNTSKLEMTTFNMPTAAFVECLAKVAFALLEETERLAKKDAFDTPLPTALGFDRPTIALHPEKLSEEEMVEEERIAIEGDPNAARPSGVIQGNSAPVGKTENELENPCSGDIHRG